MSTREQTRLQSQQLRQQVLRDCVGGLLRPGDALPTVRGLAARHGMSVSTAQRVLRGLADEGVLQLRQGAGAFVARMPGQEELAFACVFPSDPERMAYSLLMRSGFEAEASRRSTATLCLYPRMPGLDVTLEKIASGQLKIGGVLHFPPLRAAGLPAMRGILDVLSGIPTVVYGEAAGIPVHGDSAARVDGVSFDHENGGRQALRHLWGRGHRGVGFVALHHARTPISEYRWSRGRAAGFLAESRVLGRGAWVMQPSTVPAGIEVEDQELAGFEASMALMPHLLDGSVTGVVCVNHYALEGLLHALRQTGIPETGWPAIMAFDDEARDSHVLSVLRLPWDELAATAVSLLWKRAFGTPAERQAPPQNVQVSMRLVQRLAGSEHFNATRLVPAYQSGGLTAPSGAVL